MEEKKGCRGNRVDDEEQKGAIEKELEGAIVAGKAPQFEVVRFEVTNGWIDRDSSRLKIDLALILDGELIEVLDERVLRESPKNGHAFDGELGSIDLLKCSLHAALYKRWPEMGEYLEEVRVVGYNAFESELDQSHHVQISFKVACRKDGALHPVTSEGVDTIGKTRLILITIYHWVAWRLLRRLRGEERKNGKR